ncbi:MAG: orotate phosphoribosyltransferase [Candidatus Omnitrophica bacterium]|nr:orotate phosphoribosyltransferase [Candidatus Omnitrophota bacterium]MCM8791379.1 orotate phosphoribosyltransferase [Candidatus Omnitrophota bacterium]
MTEKDVLDLFEKNKALLKGHFKLSSGLHSEKYLQCALVLQYPYIAEKLAKALVARFVGEKIDLVVGPALGGVTLAYEVARSLGVRGIFTEREEGIMMLRRGFSISEGERTLVVEDVVTTGKSTNEVIEVVKTCGGIIAGVGSIIDRSDRPPNFGVKFASLAKVKVETYKSEDCPLCRAGMPVIKPGSRK